MKKINLYQVFRPRCNGDIKWSPPIVSDSDDQALSAFLELARTQPELAKSYIYRVGSYNSSTGKITLHRTPLLLTNKEIKKLTNKEIKKVKKDEIPNEISTPANT